MRWIWMLLIVMVVPAVAMAAPQPFEKFEGCRWKNDRWNDGDSFHVITGEPARELVARLYFVDTPEAETAYKDRLDEQAAYFGISREQATEIAREASAFTARRLAAPFTIWTRWTSALGRTAIGRVYCFVIDSSGRDLNELLVENGLARIFGVEARVPDGRSVPQYLERLQELEQQARAAKRGAWRFGGRPVPTKQCTVVTGAFVASKNSKVFHRAGCKSAAKIAPKNIMTFATAGAAAESGRKPCAECRP